MNGIKIQLLRRPTNETDQLEPDQQMDSEAEKGKVGKKVKIGDSEQVNESGLTTKQEGKTNQ